MISVLRGLLVRRATGFGRDDAAELAGLLAALSRAGLPAGRIWQVLADENSAVASPAGRVAGMLAVGGSVTDGLRVAVVDEDGDGAPVLGWLMVTARVAERTGAPAASIYDGLVSGIHEELEQAGERTVALAGPRATALVLGVLPLAGFVLAALMGVNTAAVLIATTAGHLCLLAGAGLWVAGQRWIARLLRSAVPPEEQMPVTLSMDLLAAVLGSGASPQVALSALADALESLGDGSADGMRLSAHRLLDGSGPPSGAATGAYRGASEGALVLAVEGALSLAVRSGLPPADLLRAAATRERSRQAMVARAAIRRLEVLLVIPAGLCLLPAFVLLGVAPVVVALFGGR